MWYDSSSSQTIPQNLLGTSLFPGPRLQTSVINVANWLAAKIYYRGLVQDVYYRRLLQKFWKWNTIILGNYTYWY